MNFTFESCLNEMYTFWQVRESNIWINLQRRQGAWQGSGFRQELVTRWTSMETLQFHIWSSAYSRNLYVSVRSFCCSSAFPICLLPSPLFVKHLFAGFSLLDGFYFIVVCCVNYFLQASLCHSIVLDRMCSGAICPSHICISSAAESIANQTATFIYSIFFQT